MKYAVYAIGDNGNGMTEKIGEYEDPTEIRIRIGLFARDVVIEIEGENDED